MARVAELGAAVGHAAWICSLLLSSEAACATEHYSDAARWV